MNEEIGLREIIEIVLKQKWIILVLTITSMLVTALISFFVITPTYETYSIVRMQSTMSEGGASVTEIHEFQESLRSASTLNSLIEKNQLSREEYRIDSIRNMFKLETIQNSNTMKIIVRGENAQKISQLANMLAFELGNRIEITDRTKAIIESETIMDGLTKQIAIISAQLNETQNQINNTPEKLITTEALSQNDLLRNIVQERSTTSAANAATLQMQSETINPVYTELQTKFAQTKIQLNALEAEANNLQEKINSNLSRINEIETKSSNDKLNINKSVRISDGTNAIFINPSIEPDAPIGPNHIFIIVIAGIIGFMFSILLAFIRHHMQTTPRSGVNV